MSLTSLISSPTTREVLRKIAPDKSLFYVDTRVCQAGEQPFGRIALLVPADAFSTGTASRVGSAFDYLLRAQVARWHSDVDLGSMRWNATYGLRFFQDYTCEPVPVHLDGPTLLSAETLALVAHSNGDDPVFAVLKQYIAACDTWVQFVAGETLDEAAVLDMVWVLAGLEGMWRRSASPYPPDPSDVAKRIDDRSKSSLLGLWKVMTDRAVLFRSPGRVIYNPEFGVASKLVGGADADIVFDEDLVEVKAVARPTYRWDHAAQMAGYVVLAAMTGTPWPIRRVGLYHARHGRMLWFDVAELARTKDLVGFGEWLLENSSRVCSKEHAEAMRQQLKLNVAAVHATAPPSTAEQKGIGPELPATPLAPDSQSCSVETAREYILGVLSEFPDREMTSQDLHKWQPEPRHHKRMNIYKVLQQMHRRGQVTKVVEDGGQVYWGIQALRSG